MFAVIGGQDLFMVTGLFVLLLVLVSQLRSLMSSPAELTPCGSRAIVDVAPAIQRGLDNRF